MTLDELIKLTEKADKSLGSVLKVANKPIDALVDTLAPKITENPQLVQNLLSTGLKKAVQKSMAAAFPKATSFAEGLIDAATTARKVTQKALAAERVAAETFALVQANGIARAAQIQLLAMANKFGADLQADLKKKLTKAVLGVASKKLQSAVFTAISSYQRGVQQAAFELPEVDQQEEQELKQDKDVPPGQYFIYVGPDDRVTRGFCGELAGKAIPDTLVDDLKNGQNLPFRKFCGGYNCRHTLVPVNHRYVIARGLDVIDSADVQKANGLARR